MKTLLGVVGAVILTLSVLIGYQLNDKPVPMGSVAPGGECHYTQFDGAIATSSLIKTGVTTFCGVVINEDQAGIVTFYNATSTAAIGTGLEDKIAIFEAAQAEGVYTFDTIAPLGLVMVSADGFSFAGNWTVLSR